MITFQSSFTLSKGIHDVLVFRIPNTCMSSVCQGKLDSGFQSLVGFRIPRAVFRIPRPKIPDSTRKNFPDSLTGETCLRSNLRGENVEINLSR